MTPAIHKHLANAIILWRFEDAPAYLRKLSTHGGDEDWLAIIPDSVGNEYPLTLVVDYIHHCECYELGDDRIFIWADIQREP